MLLKKLNMTEVLLLEKELERDNAWESVAVFFEIDTAIHLKK